ncbi:AMP-binding protein [Sulfitobacter sp. M57]|uniref:AMP-binding protein n=4 Tax=Sulfitobacter TaxID=60136 RepID=UPI0023E10184|nr:MULTISPECIES: AMP-binding protein [unclassified Sulfitobacter]MDF3435099.1 AMP-binding protein [Sulfitobacter sp. KE42]MDF3464536.1 AMP-binding protein [Sulfitobacter sp. Ks18]MDF3515198.1 AMP-binding protein [Sulfitobacter sp. M36]MDF3522895.1 AMP-binding protein [Sulfitobacter sp. M74]MDF3534597.1 AMP-binding protein [Sulfitobacter sp. S62]
MNMPDLPSVFAAFRDTATHFPDRAFLNVLPETAAIYDIKAGEISYAEAQTEVTRLRIALDNAGYRDGQRVMMLMENRPSFFLWWLALNELGLSVVPVNPDLRLTELSYMIGHAEPVLAVALPGRCDDLRNAAKAVDCAMPVVTPTDALPPPATPDRITTGSGADAEAALLYTSGTTGDPKGCILTNTYFLEAGAWYAGTGGLCALRDDGERMITPLPIFHMNAMAYSFMAMIATGGCLTVLDRFHPRSWWASVRASQATCLHYLGVMPSMLMGADPSPDDKEHNVRFGFGAGVDPKLHSAFEDRFGFPLVEAWAMTETGAGAVICANREPRLIGKSCLGTVEARLEARLIDENGALADQGELQVRRAGSDPRRGFFSGYFKNTPATDEAWQGGWFHTGDIVRRDADGMMYFVDRKKNVIRRSGENIAAVEVESTLMRHPAIANAAVAAVPDAVRGDEVLACIVLKPATTDKANLAREITEWCLTQLAYYKAPGFIAFVDALPLTATHKLQRAALKTLANTLVSNPDTIDTRPLKKRNAA